MPSSHCTHTLSRLFLSRAEDATTPRRFVNHLSFRPRRLASSVSRIVGIRPTECLHARTPTFFMHRGPMVGCGPNRSGSSVRSRLLLYVCTVRTVYSTEPRTYCVHSILCCASSSSSYGHGCKRVAPLEPEGISEAMDPPLSFSFSLTHSLTLSLSHSRSSMSILILHTVLPCVGVAVDRAYLGMPVHVYR